MSRLNDALRIFHKMYREAAPVRDGDCHDESLSEAPGEYFPTRGGGDASGKMVYKGGRKGDGPRGLRDTGRSVAPEAEGDSRRGAGGPGYPVDKSDPEDPMEPGWRGPALDDQDDDEDEARMAERKTRLRSAKVDIKCPHCGEKNRVRLPKHLSLAEGEGDGKVLRTQCGKCDEVVRFDAPEGMRFAKRAIEAASFFKSRYNYLTGRASVNPTGHLRSIIESFKRSYRGK